MSCQNCPNDARHRCQYCKITKYCSKKCQMDHWIKIHNKQCFIGVRTGEIVKKPDFKYILMRRLGGGGAAEVWSAEDNTPARNIWILKIFDLDREDIREEFVYEINLHKILNIKNVRDIELCESIAQCGITSFVQDNKGYIVSPSPVESVFIDMEKWINKNIRLQDIKKPRIGV